MHFCYSTVNRLTAEIYIKVLNLNTGRTTNPIELISFLGILKINQDLDFFAS